MEVVTDPGEADPEGEDDHAELEEGSQHLDGPQGLHGADEGDGGGAPDEDALHDGHLLLAVRVLQGLVVGVATPAPIIVTIQSVAAAVDRNTCRMV